MYWENKYVVTIKLYIMQLLTLSTNYYVLCKPLLFRSLRTQNKTIAGRQ